MQALTRVQDARTDSQAHQQVEPSHVYVIAGLNGGVRRFIVRTGLAISCLVTARFVPFLALLMALIGSFLTINVSLIFPVGGTTHACSSRQFAPHQENACCGCMPERISPFPADLVP